MIWIVLAMIVSTAIGAVAAHRKPVSTDRASRRLMDFVLWILIPIVMFFNLARFEFTVAIGHALLLSYLANAIVVLVAYLVAAKLLKLPRPQTGAVMTCALLANTAYLGYPFTAAALGFDQVPTAATYDILVSVPWMLFVGFSIGAAFGTVADRPKDRAMSFFTRNPMLYAAIAALLAPDSLAPDWAVDASRILVVVILPIGFFTVGATLQHEADEDELGFPPPLTKPVLATVALKLTVPPAILLAASSLVTKVPSAYILEAAMSTGVNNLLIANTYGLDRKLAASAIFWSTAVVAAVGVGTSFF